MVAEREGMAAARHIMSPKNIIRFQWVMGKMTTFDDKSMGSGGAIRRVFIPHQHVAGLAARGFDDMCAFFRRHVGRHSDDFLTTFGRHSDDIGAAPGFSRPAPGCRLTGRAFAAYACSHLR
jgi:hypothetical protein